jgi:glycolate oxidase iron-sulfur subunit
MSRAILDRKMRSLRAADPDYIATGNPGCLMQLHRGVAAAGLKAAVVHPVELLDRAYAQPPGGQR